jgi:hypothetical protein
MAVYFNIIIPIEKFLVDLEQVLLTHSINIYIEKYNEVQNFYYELVDIKKPNIACFSDKEYRGFFFTSLSLVIQNGKLVFDNNKIQQTDKVSFYNDELFNYCIEGKGGREDIENIESIRLRIISKSPDKQIERFYKSLQTMFKKSIDINKGLNIGQHFDSKIYYYKTKKNMLNDFTNKKLNYFE